MYLSKPELPKGLELKAGAKQRLTRGSIAGGNGTALLPTACLHCQAAACTSHWERGLQGHGAAVTALWDEAEEADSFFRRPRLLGNQTASWILRAAWLTQGLGKGRHGALQLASGSCSVSALTRLVSYLL